MIDNSSNLRNILPIFPLHYSLLSLLWFFSAVAVEHNANAIFLLAIFPHSFPFQNCRTGQCANGQTSRNSFNGDWPLENDQKEAMEGQKKELQIVKNNWIRRKMPEIPKGKNGEVKVRKGDGKGQPKRHKRKWPKRGSATKWPAL
jgi:hypothetical protein